MQNKSFSQTMSEFSKKLNRFTEAGNTKLEKPLSQDKRLEQTIHNMEQDRKNLIEKQYAAFSNPVSQQVEEDEENLLKAYNLFKQALELNLNAGDSHTKLADLRISSPLCQKREYCSGSGFSFLMIWFLKKEQDAEYVPVISMHNESRYLEFIPRDEYEFSKFEKEVLQIIPENKEQNTED